MFSPFIPALRRHARRLRPLRPAPLRDRSNALAAMALLTARQSMA